MDNIGGNYYDKYETRNPLARMLVNGFLRTFDDMTASPRPMKIFEIGCGEGVLSKRLCDRGHTVYGTDVDSDIIRVAKHMHRAEELTFDTQSIYDVGAGTLADAGLVICCEVFEHLPDPQLALDILYASGAPHVLLSVPREPLWRILNLARLKYVAQMGNTPGHLNHWSSRGFVQFAASRFKVRRIAQPMPWTFVLLDRD